MIDQSRLEAFATLYFPQWMLEAASKVHGLQQSWYIVCECAIGPDIDGDGYLTIVANNDHRPEKSICGTRSISEDDLGDYLQCSVPLSAETSAEH